MATLVASANAPHVKKSTVPETVTGEEGTAKRNIIRRGGAPKDRKGNAAGGFCDDGSTYFDPASLDVRDPNYDSEDESGYKFIPDAFHNRDSIAKSKLTLTKYKKAIEPLITEFFVTGDVDDMILNIQEIDAPEYAYECVKRAVNMSFDKSDRERELISQLLSIGYPDLFSSSIVGKGFERLFEIIDEVMKDVPSARDYLAKFLARAVVDEILPPIFLSDPVVCNLGGDIVEHAKRMLSREHGGGLLDRTWGPGDGRPVEELKVALDQCLEEYLLSSDLTEAARCIKELNAKLFYHEVVKRAVVMVISRTHEDQIQMSKLLKFLRDSDQMSSTQAIKGFRRLYGILSDLALDAPNAKAVVNDFTQRAIADGVLAADFKA